MSGVWALVPVKSLALGKSRLSARLLPAERAELSIAMLRDVLTAVSQRPGIVGGLVVHSDGLVAQVAGEMSMEAMFESPGTTDLNDALFQGLSLVSEWSANGVLILPADVPLVEPESI